MSDHAASLYGGTPAVQSALSHGTLPSPAQAAAPLRSRAESLNDSTATKLYGAPAPAPAPAQRDPAAVKLATAAPAPVAKPDEPITAAALYSTEHDGDEYAPSEAAKATYASTMRSLVESDVNRLGADPAEAEANATEVAGIFEEFAVNTSDAAYITEVAIAAAANGIDESQDARNHSAAMDVLRTDYGDNASRAMQLAQRLVAKHPSVRAYLADSGLGNHPKVVAVVAQQAWRLAAEGRL